MEEARGQEGEGDEGAGGRATRGREKAREGRKRGNLLERGRQGVAPAEALAFFLPGETPPPPPPAAEAARASPIDFYF